MKKKKIFSTLFLLLIGFCTCLIYCIPIKILLASSTSEENVYNIGSAEQLFDFAKVVQSVDDSSKISAKLTANININPGATFTYDHETGLITVTKNDKSYKMGTGLKNTELGNFHPVYNGMCTQEQWDNEVSISEEKRNELITEMNKNVEDLGLIKWTPIGTITNPFTGIFDGNGYTIDGLYVNDNTLTYAGFFGVKGQNSASLSNIGEIKNLSIGTNSLIVGYHNNVKSSTGAIAGRMQNDKITSCNNYAIVVGKGNTAINNSSCGLVGGITGFINSKVEKCINYGTIISPNSAGGIVGNVMGNRDDYGTISYCYNYGMVYSSVGMAGGIAVNAGGTENAYDYSGPIEACTNYGYVEGMFAGGIVQKGSHDVKVRYCANRGTVVAFSSSSGIVEYIGRGDFYMEGCYNAGNVSLLAYNDENESALYKIAYPLVSRIATRSTDGSAYYHSIKNCYNDKNVLSAKDNELFGEKITSTNCYSVPTESFASGEIAYKMGSNNNSGWRQNLSLSIEEVETYPTTEGTKRVYYRNHYCCHSDNKNKEAHKEIFYTNSTEDVIDNHSPNENGICTHCGKDVRLPEFLIDNLPDAKVGEHYNLTIKVNNDGLRLNGLISAVVSKDDDTPYVFSNGLTGVADYHRINEYYYYEIYGTPEKEETLTFTLIAENENGVTKKTYTLNIKGASPLEILTDNKLNNATVGENYNYQLICNTDLEKTWSLANDSKLPEGLILNKDGSISGVPSKEGTYTFTIIVSDINQTTSKTFTLVVFGLGGCKHNNMLKIEGKVATCMQDGILDYYHCNDCDNNYLDKEGKKEITNLDSLKSSSNHIDKNNDGKCDYCKKNMPVFRKVSDSSKIVYDGTYILVTKIGDKYYALVTPTNDDLMILSEIAVNPNGDFTFKTLEDKNIVMLKTEFAIEDSNLDAKMQRFGLSTISNNVRYGLSVDSGANFIMYPNEKAKYGYRIMLNSSGEVLIGSVYQEWWKDSQTITNDGILQAFDMTYSGKNVKFMSFFNKNYYENQYNGIVKKYPIYLYQMSNISQTANGITFISNDTNSNVSKGNTTLPDIVDVSNVTGLANAIDEKYLESLIEKKATGQSDVSASVYATIEATNLETREDGKTIVSVKYAITPMITITNKEGTIIYQGEVLDSNLNGSSIIVRLYVGSISPVQIIHYKEDGTKEYFYALGSNEVIQGANSFTYENEFVTFTIDSFSNIEILTQAKEENVPNKDIPTTNNTKLSAGKITIVIVVSTLLVGIITFAIVWFIVLKKSFIDIISAIKNIFKKNK